MSKHNKKRRIAAALLSAVLVTALGCTTVFAAQARYATIRVNLFSPYTRYYGRNYGDTAEQRGESWMRMEYVTGTSIPGSDAAARTSVYTAPGMQGYAYVRAKNKVGSSTGSSVTLTDYMGWVTSAWNKGQLNGSGQDDFCIEVNHYGTRIGGGLNDYYDVYYTN